MLNNPGNHVIFQNQTGQLLKVEFTSDGELVDLIEQREGIGEVVIKISSSVEESNILDDLDRHIEFDQAFYFTRR